MADSAKPASATRADRMAEASLDTVIEDSFPASDPPANTPVAGTRKAEESAHAHDHGHDVPQGNPSGDRHATETAAAMIHGVHPAETDDRDGSS